MTLKYNYVLFDANKNSFYKLTLNDLKNQPSIKVLNPPMCDKSKFERFIYRCHINERLHLPFKSIWNKRLFVNTFKDDKPICFMFSSELIHLKRLGFFEYLKKKYKDCKLVYYCRDLFDLYFERYKNFNLVYMKKTFDLILNYDLEQVLKYDLTFYSDFESMIDLKQYESCEKSDVVFVGAAKGRLNKILDCYDYLTSNGLKCDFYIVGASTEIQQKYPNITFSEKWLEYEEVLKKIANSRCILEIIQDNSIGYSARAMKAFGYNKKLITTSPTICFTRFYDGYNVQVIKDAKDINASAIKDNCQPNYEYANEFSPLKVMEYLDFLFSEKTTPKDYYSKWFDLNKYELYLKNNTTKREE